MGKRAYKKNITVTKNIPFSIKYKLRGINAISVMPSGKNNTVEIIGNRKDPSFTGEFLPLLKHVHRNGHYYPDTCSNVCHKKYRMV